MSGSQQYESDGLRYENGLPVAYIGQEELTEEQAGYLSTFTLSPSERYFKEMFPGSSREEVNDFQDYVFPYGISLLYGGQINAAYILRMLDAQEYLGDNLEQSLQSKDKFIEMLNEYGWRGAYHDKSPFLRKRLVYRKYECDLERLTPVWRETGISPGKEHRPQDTVSDKDVIYTEIYELTQHVLNSEDKAEAYAAACHLLYTMIDEWIWGNGLRSRAIGFWNHLLERVGIEPMPHGATDYMVYSLNREDFVRYMFWLAQVAHGQSLDGATEKQSEVAVHNQRVRRQLLEKL